MKHALRKRKHDLVQRQKSHLALVQASVELAALQFRWQDLSAAVGAGLAENGSVEWLLLAPLALLRQ